MQLFGTSGIRRVADEQLIQQALKVGLAVGNWYRNVVVGCDTRTSSDAVKHAVISGLLTAGCRCYDAGVVPTPTLALATKQFDAGVMITASHNPPQYNGIKLLNPDGSAFDMNKSIQLEKMVAGELFFAAPWDRIFSASTYDGTVEQHIERILQDFPNTLKLRIVLDCGCGAGAMITPHLLKSMGCDVISINCNPSGFFPHDVEPIEANLTDLIKITRESGAHLGIAHDGDADRMMAVDDKGRFISGDKLMVIFIQAMGIRDVITTIDASMVIDEVAQSVTRTEVGDVQVSKVLSKRGDFGGEPSGCWIFPNISLCPDGIYAAATIASIASQQRLSQLVDKIPQYTLIRHSLAVKELKMSKVEQQLMVMNYLEKSTIDGIKLSFKDGWLLIRASGTEPKIRITAEAKSKARATRLFNSGIKAIHECMEAGKAL